MSASGDAPAADAIAKRFRSASVYALATMASGSLLGLANAILMARILGATILGQLAIAIILLQGFNLLSNAGEQSGLYFEVARRERTAREIAAVLWATSIFSEVITLALCVPFMVIAHFILVNIYHQPNIFGPLLASLIIYLIFTNISSLLDLTLQGLMAQTQRMHIATSAGVISILATITIPFLFGHTLYVAIALVSVTSIITAMLQLLFLQRLISLRVSVLDIVRGFRHIPSILSYGLRWAPNNLSSVILNYADTAILAALVSPALVGAYGRAYTIFDRMTGVSLAVRGTLFPAVAKLYAAGDLTGIARLVRRTFRTLTAFAFPATCGIAALSPSIMALFGPDFIVASAALAWLSLGIACNVLSMLNSAVTGGSGAPGRVSLCIAAGAIVNLLGNLRLDPHFGIAGAALANSTGMAVMAGTGIVVVARRMQTPVSALLDFPFLAKVVIASGSMGLAVWAESNLLSTPLILPIGIASGIGIYAVLCKLLVVFDQAERAQMAGIYSRARDLGGLLLTGGQTWLAAHLVSATATTRERAGDAD